MAIKTLYVCDMCGKEREYAFLTDYELHSDYHTDKMYKHPDTKTIELCEECGKKLAEPFMDKKERELN